MTNLSHSNSKKQGNVGIGKCIAWATEQGFIVSIPLTDSQDYDLIVDNGVLNKIQVKTTRYKKKKHFVVNLSVKGGNRSCNTVKFFNNTTTDFLFVITESGDSYYIPCNIITQLNELTLTPEYDKYKI